MFVPIWLITLAGIAIAFLGWKANERTRQLKCMRACYVDLVQKIGTPETMPGVTKSLHSWLGVIMVDHIKMMDRFRLAYPQNEERDGYNFHS